MFMNFSYLQDYNFIKFFHAEGQDKKIADHFHVKAMPCVVMHMNPFRLPCAPMNQAAHVFQFVAMTVIATGLANLQRANKSKQNFLLLINIKYTELVTHFYIRW